MQRGESLTAYTPYQPELSQGVLQAIFEYQTAICELTGMDVSNASGYDGTRVAADACPVAEHATGRSKIVITEATNPQVRHVVQTSAPGFGLELVEVPRSGGRGDGRSLQARAQHTQRKHGTANMPADQPLLALGRVVYATRIEPPRIRELGERCLALPAYAKQKLAERAECELVFANPSTF